MVLDRLLLIPNAGDGYTARQRCGERMGIVGIGFNLVLFALKLTVGIISGAVSVIADALNNLSCGRGASFRAWARGISGGAFCRHGHLACGNRAFSHVG